MTSLKGSITITTTGSLMATANNYGSENFRAYLSTMVQFEGAKEDGLDTYTE